jgi:outer membrane protein
MKPVTALAAVFALALTLTASHAQLKVGVVDMNQAFVDYYKTKDAEAKINESRNQAKTELDDRLATLNKAVEEINKMQQELQRPELSNEAKEAKTKDLNDKANETRNLDREVSEFRATRERQIQEQFVRMRKDIIDEIMKIVDTQIKAKGFDLVLDKSGLSMGQIPVLLYSRADMDFTKEIIATLNKDAPRGAAAN